MNLSEAVMGSLFDKVYEAIEVSAITRKTVYVDKFFRGVGKTTALVKLAKKYGLYLVVPNGAMASLLERETGYEKIYSQNELRILFGLKEAYVVFDEGVDQSKLVGLNVVTGIECI